MSEAPTTSPQRVAIDDLVAVPEFQIRRRTDPSTVARYAGLLRAGVILPPVKAGRIEGALVLIDGFHRVEAHRRAGVSAIMAEIIPVSEREARWLAAEANMAHGLPLTRSERREAFKAFVQAGRHLDARRRLLSLREMARACGAGSHNTILSWLRKDFPRIARQLQGENPRGGGCRGVSVPSLSEIAEESIRQAIAAARGVPCEVERGALAAILREAAGAIERGEPPSVLTSQDQPGEDSLGPIY